LIHLFHLRTAGTKQVSPNPQYQFPKVVLAADCVFASAAKKSLLSKKAIVLLRRLPRAAGVVLEINFMIKNME
jgi:hypothetical protein